MQSLGKTGRLVHRGFAVGQPASGVEHSEGAPCRGAWPLFGMREAGLRWGAGTLDRLNAIDPGASA